MLGFPTLPWCGGHVPEEDLAFNKETCGWYNQSVVELYAIGSNVLDLYSRDVGTCEDVREVCRCVASPGNRGRGECPSCDSRSSTSEMQTGGVAEDAFREHGEG